tara:strand:- start:920 stop:1789 length:870 start_codon:yes stop_codon:yes gene_type:complete
MKLFIFIFILSLSIYLYRFIFVYLKQLKKQKLLIDLGSNFFIQLINNIIEENKYNLYEERRRIKEIDAYGNENLNQWFGNPPIYENQIKENISKGASKFKEGIPYFWLKVIVKNFGTIELFFEKWNYYILKNPIIEDETLGVKRKLSTEDWFIFVASLIEKSCLKLINESEIKTNEKYKKGINFENHCSQILKSQGWMVKETPITGDQGVDLIASIAEYRLCIQCKDHQKPIGNKAVQEIYAGRQYWLGTHAILVSNSGFTKSAHKLALSNKVILINESELKNIGNIIY